VRQYLGEIFRELARQRESVIVEGHLCPDHVHVYIPIPPKYAVSQVMGYIKGKSAIAIARTLMAAPGTSRVKASGLAATTKTAGGYCQILHFNPKHLELKKSK